MDYYEKYSGYIVAKHWNRLSREAVGWLSARFRRVRQTNIC